jgi:hypothetical protein
MAKIFRRREIKPSYQQLFGKLPEFSGITVSHQVFIAEN